MLRPTSFLVLAALGLVGLLARPAMAADWSVQPAANQFGGGREDFSYTVNPGGRSEDALVVTNSSTAPLPVTVRAPAWVELEQDALTVPAGEAAEVPFAVAASADADPGDRVAAITVAAGGSEAQLPVRLRVGGPLTPRLAVEDVRVHDEQVTYVLHNTGNAVLGAHQTVSVSGPFGRFAAKVAAIPDTAELLPGERREVSAPVSGITPAVRLTATVTVVPLLTDAAGSTAPLPPAKATGHAWAIPWLPLATLVLVGALVTLALRRRARSSLTRVTPAV